MLPPHPHSHPHSRTRNGSHPHTSAMPPTPVNSCAVCRAAPDRCAHARSASRMRVARPPPPPSPRRRQRRRRRSRPPKGCAVRPFYLFWTHPLQHSASFRPPLRPVVSYPSAPQCTHLLGRSARLHLFARPLCTLTLLPCLSNQALRLRSCTMWPSQGCKPSSARHLAMRSRRRSSTPCLDSPRPALSPFLLGPVYPFLTSTLFTPQTPLCAPCAPLAYPLTLSLPTQPHLPPLPYPHAPHFLI